MEGYYIWSAAWFDEAFLHHLFHPVDPVYLHHSFYWSCHPSFNLCCFHKCVSSSATPRKTTRALSHFSTWSSWGHSTVALSVKHAHLYPLPLCQGKVMIGLPPREGHTNSVWWWCGDGSPDWAVHQEWQEAGPTVTAVQINGKSWDTTVSPWKT